MNENIKSILEYLKAGRGLDFSGCRPSMIERRIAHRLSVTKSKDAVSYLACLKEHGDELDHLAEALTINVSRFFRNSFTFEYIAHKILPLLVQQKANLDDGALRVWSAGCAFGEEPYSIAILIKELLAKEKLNLSFQVFATDIDKNALKRAQKAVYGSESLRDVKYALLKQYFTPLPVNGKSQKTEEEMFRLNAQIRDAVIFSFYDMLNPRSYAPPVSIFGDFDMVLCRNLLIYFNAEHQEIIFDKLHRSLRKDGYLVLGEAEVPSLKHQRHFKNIDTDHHIYQKRRER